MSAARTKGEKEKYRKTGCRKGRTGIELPVGSLSSAARIELMGNKRVIVDGCHGIVEYSDDLVRMQTGSGMIRFKGTMLSISCLTEDSAIIEGNILSLEYLS